MLSSHSSFRYSVRAPSNIALVKYWGKYDRQLARNPSLSFTLNELCTQLTLEVLPQEDFQVELIFDDQRNILFEQKITQKLSSMMDQIPWLAKVHLKINSTNNFPHSAGIASSASSMAALSFALGLYQDELLGVKTETKVLSSWARLLSGSASRSIEGPVMLWGKISPELGNDHYAEPLKNVAPCFNAMMDTIVLIDEGSKEVSSSTGHQLMNAHPYKEARYDLARDHLKILLTALSSGDMDSFGAVVELEALNLHALMMTSDPSYILMKPDTLRLIQELREFRQDSKKHWYFTLDAGANVHILHSQEDKNLVTQFLVNRNFPKYLQDTFGSGAQRVL